MLFGVGRARGKPSKRPGRRVALAFFATMRVRVRGCGAAAGSTSPQSWLGFGMAMSAPRPV
jgi:hypothetical protein